MEHPFDKQQCIDFFVDHSNKENENKFALNHIKRVQFNMDVFEVVKRGVGIFRVCPPPNACMQIFHTIKDVDSLGYVSITKFDLCDTEYQNLKEAYFSLTK